MAKVQFPKNSVVLMVESEYTRGNNQITVGAWFYEDKFTSCIFIKSFKDISADWIKLLASYCDDFAFNGVILQIQRFGFSVDIKQYSKEYKKELARKEDLSIHLLDLKEDIDLYESYLMLRGASMASETANHPFFERLDLKKFPVTKG